MGLLLAGVAVAETWLPLNEQGNLLRENGRCRQAVPVLKQAKSTAIQELGPKHPFVAIPTNNLATAFLCLDELTRAEELFRECLAILDNDPTDLMQPGILNNLAILLMRLSRLQEAEQLLERALALSETRLGPHHRHTASVTISLGVLWLRAGQYMRARDMLRRSVDIWEISVGTEHTGTATALNNLGVAHLYLGEYEQARVLTAQALERRRRLLPARHPDIAESLHNYAVSLEKLGQRKLARKAFGEAGSIRKTHVRDNVLGVTVDVRLLKAK
jgi:tetratricopeptide (TPR) repeat protein